MGRAAASNSEEGAAGLTAVVPFLLEDVLIESGGNNSKGDEGQDHVVSDGALITGQNPASSATAARALLARQTRQCPP